MTVTWSHVDFAKRIYCGRIGDPYVFGGSWDQYDATIGNDCSGTVSNIIEAIVNGPARMAWPRQFSTETWRPVSMGGNADPTNGPYGCQMVNSPNDFPADAALKIAISHGPGGGVNSHMWCETYDGFKMETNGSLGTCPFAQSREMDDSIANNWWYLPGPVSDPSEGDYTIFADVSYFQNPVNDQYPYRILSFRSNDGTFQDTNFAQNYHWATTNCDRNWLDAFIVYFYWRANWDASAQTLIDMVDAAGGPHPQMIVMIDLESGGNPSGDQSAGVNGAYDKLVNWLGDSRRVIGYANQGDERTMWQSKPSNLELIMAGYGANPPADNDFTKLAHQYTDGTGFGGGLPEGATPFGTPCDMNSADGVSSLQFAQSCGISPQSAPAPVPAPAPTPVTPATVVPANPSQEWIDLLTEVWKQFRG